METCVVGYASLFYDWKVNSAWDWKRLFLTQLNFEVIKLILFLFLDMMMLLRELDLIK